MQLPQRHEGTKNEITITYDDTFRDYFSLFHTLVFFTELIFFFVFLRVLVSLWRFFFLLHYLG